jgi:hypothetical protein
VSLSNLQMSTRKSSAVQVQIQKGGNIKPAVVTDGSIQYDPLDGFDTDDPKSIEDIVRNIEQLDKAGHEQIYMQLRRNGKAKTFFATNSIDTRFNIYGLTPVERRALKRTIQLCMEDMERNKVLNSATRTHQEAIAKLDCLFPAIDEMYLDPVGPSEADKIKEMLQMNLTH